MSGQTKAPSPDRPAEVVAGSASPAPDHDCLTRLTAAGFEIETAAPPRGEKEACVIDTPVRLKAVKVDSRPQRPVRLPDEPVLACRFAERLGQWIGELAAPVVAGRLGSDLEAVHTGPGYECRNRNRAENGKLSAHATGLAVDIQSFDLANGGAVRVGVTGDGRMAATLGVLRISACGWFTTVLGPGSDAAHADHLHVDVLRHGSSDRFRICE